MKKIIVTLAVGLAAFAVQADVLVSVGSDGAKDGRVLTLTETVEDTLVISASSGTFTDDTKFQQPSGTFTATAPVGAFSVTYNGYFDWNNAAGKTALESSVSGDFDTYLGGLTSAMVSFNNLSGIWGGASNFRVNQNGTGTNQAMVLTFDADALNAGMQLSLKGIDLLLANNVTVAIYGSDDTIKNVDWSFTGDWAGDVSLNTGDRLIMVSGAADGSISDFAVDNLSYDIIPEPATFGLFALFGGGILLIRRRRLY